MIEAFRVTRSGLTVVPLSDLGKAPRNAPTWIQVTGELEGATKQLLLTDLHPDARDLLEADDLASGVTRKGEFVLVKASWAVLGPDLKCQEAEFQLLLSDGIVFALVPKGFPIPGDELIELTPKDLIRRSGLDAVLWAFWDQLVQKALEQIRALERSVRDFENKLIETQLLSREDQVRLFNLGRSLTAIRLSMLPMREQIGALYRYDLEDNRELYPYFLDLQSNLDRLAAYSGEVREQIAGLLDVNLSMENHRQSLVTKRISAWAAIVAVPTAITGFFGQNIPFFGYGTELGVLFSLGLISITSIALFIGFKNRRWL